MSGLAALVVPSAAFSTPFRSNRIDVRVQGAGRDVILIHGVDSSRDVWAGTIVALNGYRWHLVQIAGFAGVPASGNASGALVAPIASEIARYIEAAGLDRPAVVGHSMGGTSTLYLAARYGNRISRAMVVDMLPAPAGLVGGSASGMAAIADQLHKMFSSTPEGRNSFAALMRMFGGSANAAPDKQSDPDVTARALHELAQTDLTSDLPKIRIPLTVVYATPKADRAVDPQRITAQYRAAYAGAKTARLIPIANSGHMIMYDRPIEFRAALKAFLDRP